MNHELLEEVLACPALPTLPLVAVEILKLTGNEDVSLDELAEVIESDQGLAARVLRTINSPLYGLRQPCASIPRALVLMGLTPVKSLALGFSLVRAVGNESDGRFGYVGYWRRALMTAASARMIAEETGQRHADEAFLGGLLQDIGMIALYRALGDDYLGIIARAGGDHRELSKHELAALDIQHSDIGALLAGRWRLPDELVLPIKYHERPTAAPRSCCELIRCVALGNLMHDVLTDTDPAHSLRRLYNKAHEWFRLERSRVNALLARVTESTAELCRSFSLKAGAMPDVDRLLTEATSRLVEMSRQERDRADSVPAPCRSGAGSEFDPLTGALCRSAMDECLRRCFRRATESGQPLSVLLARIDRFGEFRLRAGPERGDEALLAVTTLLKREFDTGGAYIGRFEHDCFLAVLPGTPRLAALRGAESIACLVKRVSEFTGTTLPGLAVSIGVASLDARSSRAIGAPEQLLAAATRVLEDAGAEGGGCIRAVSPKAA